MCSDRRQGWVVAGELRESGPKTRMGRQVGVKWLRASAAMLM